MKISLALTIFLIAIVVSDEDIDDTDNDQSLDYLLENFLKNSQNLWSKIGNILTIKLNELPQTEDNLTNSRNTWIAYQKTVATVINSALNHAILILPLLTSSNIESECFSTLLSLESIEQQKSYIFKMLDSSGRPFSRGILAGTITDFGAFDQCIKIRSPLDEIKGRYCVIKYRLSLPPRPSFLTLQTRLYNFTNTSVEGTFFQDIADLSHMFYERYGRFALCIPSSCTKSDLVKLISNNASENHITYQVSHCEIDAPWQFSALQTFTIALLGLLFIMMIISTLLDMLCNITLIANLPKNKSKITQTIEAFSLQANMQSLFNAVNQKSSLDAINGIRVLSMAFVIYTHTYLIPIKETFAFSKDFINAVEGLFFQFILNGWVLVDSFFCVGSLLFVYNQLNAMRSKGKINFLEIIMNRFFRLSPPLWFTILLMFLIPSLGSGPLWKEYFDYETDKCYKYWWLTIFYINNWFPESMICLIHTWYLSADIQLFLVSLILIIPLYKYGEKGLYLYYLVGCLSVLSVFMSTYIRNAPPTVIYNHPGEVIKDDQVLSVYTPTYIHLAPYIVGAIAGYLIHKKREYTLNKYLVAFLWAITILNCIFILFSTYPWNSGSMWTPMSASIYACLHRVAWSASIAWIAFACVSGNGGFINNFLSCKFFLPLSKLSFMVYLLHFLVLWLRYAYLRERLPFSHYTMFCEFLVNLILSTFAGAIGYLLIEMPLYKLYRIHLSGRFNWANIKLS